MNRVNYIDGIRARDEKHNRRNLLQWVLLLMMMVAVGYSASITYLSQAAFKNTGENVAATYTTGSEAVLEDPEPPKSAEKDNLAVPTVGLPVRLRIPKIGADAKINHLGLTRSGNMDVPKNIADTGWFNGGPRPGQMGSAVIDGHYGWKNGEQSVFDNLHKLQKRDKVFVKDDAGTTFTFSVVGSRTYNPNAKTSEIFVSTDGKQRLNLITCEGAWNKATNSYPKRLVVFTELVST